MTGAVPRVVSLLPSVTETLHAWGTDPVACTRFCERPDLPHVGGTKDPDLAAIVDLAPDAVIVDTEENRIDDARSLQEAGVEVFITEVHAVADVGPTLAALAEGMGVRFDQVAFDAAVAEAVLSAEGTEWRGETAYVPIWRRPWMTIGGETYGSSVLEAIGLQNAFAADPARYPEAGPAEAARLRASLVLAPSEPYPFGLRHVPELERVGPVTLVDGRDLFGWGVRTPAALRRLARLSA